MIYLKHSRLVRLYSRNALHRMNLRFSYLGDKEILDTYGGHIYAKVDNNRKFCRKAIDNGNQEGAQ